MYVSTVCDRQMVLQVAMRADMDFNKKITLKKNMLYLPDPNL